MARLGALSACLGRSQPLLMLSHGTKGLSGAVTDGSFFSPATYEGVRVSHPPPAWRDHSPSVGHGLDGERSSAGDIAQDGGTLSLVTLPRDAMASMTDHLTSPGRGIIDDFRRAARRSTSTWCGAPGRLSRSRCYKDRQARSFKNNAAYKEVAERPETLRTRRAMRRR